MDSEVSARLLQQRPTRDKREATIVGQTVSHSLVLEPGQVFCQRFRLIGKLGEGGMGQVWLALQTSPVRRRVALKLIRAGMYDEAVVQRFQAERQSLAIMDHPGIAKVLDAGATEQGQPYFVMEYVPGLPITEYCEQKKLTIERRLQLFIQACEGVQHAHQKAIIHRDLKPANILVVEVDGKPVPRIIDFGLAKATTRADGETLSMQMDSPAGTPAYMSPEQADPAALDIDTRTDVYSLGVVLYVLLTGMLPIDMKQWQERPLEVLQKLREEEPVLPSAKVGTDINRSTATAEARSTEPTHLVKLLRGDLDWITMKALEKDRMRRYGSPSDLAADIQRHLQHQPVLARPPSASYRAGKFIRRHRFGVGTAVAAVALLIAFATAMGLQALRIAEERDRANRIADFMTQMFRVSDPSEAQGNSVTARAILDKASNEIKAGLARDPEMQSELMFTMARTYANLGLYSVAHELSATALESRRRLLGPEDSKTLESMTQLGWILDRQGRDDEAEKLTRQAVDQGRRVLGSEHTVTLEAMENLAAILERQAHFEEEERLQRQLIEIRTRRLGPEDPLTLRSMVLLANALGLEGRFTESEQLYRKALGIELRVLGSEHPQTLRTMHDLANRIQEQGRYAEAEGLYRETLAIEQHVLGRGHPDSATTMVTLANTLYYEGRAAEAEKLYRESLEIEQRALGLEHPYTTRAQEGLANVLADEGHLAEAEKLRRQVLEIRQHTLGPEHTDTLLSKYNMADLLRSEGHFAEAERMIREVLAAQARVLGPENPDTLASKATLARILIKEGRYPEAENMARHVLEIQLRVLGPQHLDTLNTLQFLGVAMVYDRHYGEAKKLFSDTIEKISKTQGTETNVSLAWYNFACVAAAAHDPDEAVHHLREAVNHGYKNLDQIRADDDLKSLRGHRNFEEFLAYAQKRADAQQQHN